MNHSYIATLISPSKNSHLIELAKSIATEMGNGEIVWLCKETACDIPIANSRSKEQALAYLQQMLSGLNVDFAIQNESDRRKKVLIADMDSTMIDQECIDELAAEIGVKEQVAAITAKAMNGEIEFESALRERVMLLKGLHVSVSGQVIENRITLAKGGKILLATMKHHGAWAALVSGGFTLFTEQIAGMLGFDENHANVLIEENDQFTGMVAEPILGAEAKVAALEKIAFEKRLTPKDFIAVGDGANDLPMLKLAGTGVALHAKPTVAAEANIRIDHGDLTALLYLQGYKHSEFVDA